jgi:hypothetical protein
VLTVMFIVLPSSVPPSTIAGERGGTYRWIQGSASNQGGDIWVVSRARYLGVESRREKPLRSPPKAVRHWTLGEVAAALDGRLVGALHRQRWRLKMMIPETGRLIGILYAVAMAAVIVGVDLTFFRNHLWERLAVNIGIVLVFVAFYFRFLKHP